MASAPAAGAVGAKRPREGGAGATLASDLARSDKVAQQAVVVATPAERSALSTFCALTLQRKAAEAAAAARVKEVKPQLKALRAALLRGLKARDHEVLQVPLELRREADARASAAGLPPVPPYVRLVRNNKDLTITPDIINEVVRSLTPEDIAEAEGADGVSALLTAVLNGVRRAVRSYTEQVKLTESAPRGTRAADIPVAPEAIAREAIRLHERGAFVLAAERAKRDAMARVREALTAPTATLDAFFTRGDITHQRVTLEGQPYNVCRRTTISKPKVTFKVLQEVLHEGIVDALGKAKASTASAAARATASKDAATASKDAVAAALLAGNKREELQRLVAMKLASLPPTSKSTIHLQRVVPRGAAADADDADSADSGSDSEPDA